jgi:hypothetical protein
MTHAASIRATSLGLGRTLGVLEKDVRQIQNRQGLLHVTRIPVGTDEIAASPSPRVNPYYLEPSQRDAVDPFLDGAAPSSDDVT